MTSFNDLTTANLKEAIQIREQIESLQEKLGSLLGSAPSTSTKRKVGRPAKVKRTMSAAGRAAIAAAQKARWAKTKETPASKRISSTDSPKKKVMSPEAKAKIGAAMKARWAARRKGAAA